MRIGVTKAAVVVFKLKFTLIFLVAFLSHTEGFSSK